MNTVGMVPIRDYVSNVATASELDEIEALIRERRQELAQRPAVREDPMKAARDLCTA